MTIRRMSNTPTQLNWDGFSLADLTTYAGLFDLAIQQRLTGANSDYDTAEEFEIQGLKLKRTPLEYLVVTLAGIRNAIARKSINVNGVGEILTVFGDP